jgi:hypothetical protein
MAVALEETSPLQRESSDKLALLATLGATSALYFLAAGYLVSRSLDVMTADAVSYLRIAEYYAQGRFDLAVNSCWGPLLSWLLVPAVLLKVDLPLAVRVVQVLSGFGFAASVALLTRRFTGGRGAALGFAAGALLALPMIPDSITPDLTLAFFIALYIALMAPLVTGGSIAAALGAGVVAGLAFWTKHFALPFVVAHLLLTLALRAYLARKRLLQGSAARPILVVGSVFAAMALPWIAAMSIHDGKFTVSSAGPYARATTYAVLHHTKYSNHRLQEPREGRIVVSENRLEGKYPLPDFPKLASLEGVKERLLHLNYYGPLAVRFTKSADLFGMLLCAALIALLHASRPGTTFSDSRTVLGAWACASAGHYIAGYVATNVEERLLWPSWGILLALAVAVFVYPSRERDDAPPSGRFLGVAPWIWAAVLLVSVGYDAAESLPLKGHFAVNGTKEKVFAAYAMAYWTHTPLLGSFDGATPEAIAQELQPFGEAQALIISDPDLENRLSQNPQFELLKSVDAYTLFAYHPK